jgi:hypothetical protein
MDHSGGRRGRRYHLRHRRGHRRRCRGHPPATAVEETLRTPAGLGRCPAALFMAY